MLIVWMDDFLPIYIPLLIMIFNISSGYLVIYLNNYVDK